MPTLPDSQRSIADLFAELQTAVQARNHARALELETAILQLAVREAAARAALERRVRALMSELNAGADAPTVPVINLLDLERATAVPRTQGTVFPVWFGTNRVPTADASDFTNARNERITRGRTDVFVPEAHRFGESGSGFWKRFLRGKLRDDRLRLQGVSTQESAPFFAELQAAMQLARDSNDEPHALFFLHGYNVTFQEAAIRAAQIGYDLKVPGATAFFSWPSRGSVTAYPADEACIEASEPAISEFFADFVRNCGAKRVHVIAHSMGSRGLLRSFARIAADATKYGTPKLEQIILAAPDVDRDVFLDLARVFPRYAQRTTLYASNADRAVHLSAQVHDAPRAGYYTPYTVMPGVDTVAVPDFDIDLLGHAYFAQAEALLHDIHDLMLHGEAPAKRQRVSAAAHEGVTFWKLQR